jgi:CRISPR-associated endonuclease/helicase Cas3
MTALAHSARESTPSGHALLQHLQQVAHLAADFAELFDSADFAKIAGLWHDLGKYAPGFQDRIRAVAEAHVEGTTGYGDHASAGAIHALEKLGPCGEAIALIIAGHHGGLGNASQVLLGRLKEPDKLNRLAHSRSKADAAILASDVKPLPEFLRQRPGDRMDDASRRTEFWIRMLFSCLVDADFLDTEAYFKPEKEQKRKGLEYLCPAKLLALFDTHMVAKTQGAKPSIVNTLRQRVLADCRRVGRESDRGVFTLTAPTGSGKTLAAMAFALEHAVRNGMGRVIVVIPYTSIIDQNAKVYRDVFGAANVIDHHASIDPDKETARNRIACENWDAPIIVTTSVQFVESLFSNKTSRCRKLHNIVNSVVLIDEAQTLPVGHLEPILDVMKELVANYRVSLCLSTATQPALNQSPHMKHGFTQVKEIIADVPGLFAGLKRVEVKWPVDRKVAVTWEELAGELKKHRQVLCVVHRRDDARELAELVEGSIHLSALMCPEHRLAVIDQVRRMLEDNKPITLISTQLIEAGVDVDFPVVYRALGGLDSIAQAAGRCNREGSLEMGRVEVFVAPTQPPPGVPQIGKGVTEMMLDDGNFDALAPESFNCFFLSLYCYHGVFDEQKIQGERQGKNFENVAKKFALIEDDGSVPVVVPYGDAAARVQALRENGPSRDRLRGLQPYMVKVYKHQCKAFKDVGAIEEVCDCVLVIREAGFADLYDKRFGLTVSGQMSLDARSLIS